MPKFIRMFVSLALLALATAVAQPPAAMAQAKGKKSQSEQKRSTIQEVTGVAFIGENMTLKMAREAAYLNARQKAVKNALSYVQSLTAMKDYQITDALVKSYAEGNVRVLQDKDNGLKGLRYSVWMRAEVWFNKLMDRKKLEKELRPVLVKKTEPPVKKPKLAAAVKTQPLQKTPKRLLSVDIWTSKKVYKNGELMKIHLIGNRDFYGKVMYEDAAGNIVRLLPNNYRRNNYFKAGKEYVIPGKGDKFQLTVQVPFGRERVSVYASTQPTGDAGGRELANGMVLVKERDRKKLGLRVRGVNISPANGGKSSGRTTEFFEAVYRVRTRR